MNPKAQAGLEYLMTYGWALVLVAAIVGVLVFVASSPASSAVFSSSDAAKMPLKSSALSGASAEIMLQNLTGGEIEVESVHFFGGLGAGSGFSLNGEAVFPVSVPVGSELLFSGLAADAGCSGGGSMLAFYTDRFGFERTVRVNCNGGAKMPVLWYRFEEGIGEFASDGSGNGNDGTLFPVGSEPAWVSGCPSGKCLQFAGDDYVIKNPFPAFPSGEISASFWMRSSDSINDGTPVSYAVSGGDNHFLLYSYRGFSIFRNSSVSTGISANNGNWHHILVTWKGSDGRAKLFKDGAQAYSGTLASGTKISSGGSLVLAQEQDSVGGGFSASQSFKGLMDEVKIFDRALTPFEVCSLCREHAANAGVACSC